MEEWPQKKEDRMWNNCIARDIISVTSIKEKNDKMGQGSLDTCEGH